MTEEYAIVNGWLVEIVDYHTCGTGPNGHYGTHEPGCGQIPIGKVEDLLTDASRAYEARQRLSRPTPSNEFHLNGFPRELDALRDGYGEDLADDLTRILGMEEQ